MINVIIFNKRNLKIMMSTNNWQKNKVMHNKIFIKFKIAVESKIWIEIKLNIQK